MDERPKIAEAKGKFHEVVIHILKMSPCPTLLIDF
jgi:hypothetical protein